MLKNFFNMTFFRRQPDDIGEELFNWRFKVYEKHERSKRWYVIAGALVTVLLIYAVATVNFLFAIIVLMFVFVGVFQHYQEPFLVSVRVAEDGILVDQKFYEFKELGSFWMVYDPPYMKNIYFEFKGNSNKSLSLPLEQANPLILREILEKYLKEDLTKEEEYFDETLAKVLKLQ